MLQHSTLRPGLLVSLKTSVTGNVSYFKTTIEADHIESDGSRRAMWETERKIADPAEHERAVTTRSAARHLIAKVCSATAFGLLCPLDRADKLEEAIGEARKMAAEFNATSSMTRLELFILTGRVEQNDVEAIRAINSEVRDLLADMEEGLANLDVKAVRAAANKAKGLGQMLTPDASDRIKEAIDLARESAKKIVKAGEGAAVEVDRANINRIAQARTAFLDLDAAGDVVQPVGVGRAVEFEPEAPVDAPATAKPAPVAYEM